MSAPAIAAEPAEPAAPAAPAEPAEPPAPAESARLIRPYGDTTGDGMVQVSFTLPMSHDKRAEGAAL